MIAANTEEDTRELIAKCRARYGGSKYRELFDPAALRLCDQADAMLELVEHLPGKVGNSE